MRKAVVGVVHTNSRYLSRTGICCGKKQLAWIQTHLSKVQCISCMHTGHYARRCSVTRYSLASWYSRSISRTTITTQKRLLSHCDRKTKVPYPLRITAVHKSTNQLPSLSPKAKRVSEEISDFCDTAECYRCSCVYDSKETELQILRKVSPALTDVLCVEDWDRIQEEANQSYPWTFENLEISLFVEGKFQVLLEGASDSITFERGDMVIFPKGAIGQVTIVEQCRRRSLVCTEMEWNTRLRCALDALKSREDEDKRLLKSERVKQNFRSKETFPSWVGFVLADLIQFGAAFSIYYFWDNGPGTFIKNSILVFILKQIIIPLGMISVFLSILGHLYIGIEPYITNKTLKNGIENVFYFLAPSNIIIQKFKEQMKEDEKRTETWDHF